MMTNSNGDPPVVVDVAEKQPGDQINVDLFFTMDDLINMKHIFEIEGGRVSRTLPFERFTELVADVLLRSERIPNISRVEMITIVTRWCFVLAKPRHVKRKLHSGQVVRSPLRSSRNAAAVASASLSTMGISWTDVTSHLLSFSQQRELSGGDHSIYQLEPEATPSTALIGARRHHYYEHVEVEHDIAPTHARLSTTRAVLFTGGKDGVVKEWSSTTGAFSKNIYNAGSQDWIVGIDFAEDTEGALLVATSSSRIALLTLSSRGGAPLVVREFVGVENEFSAPSQVPLFSTAHTQRYGLRPGDRGPSKAAVNLDDPEMTQQAFIAKWHEASEHTSIGRVRTIPLVGLTRLACFACLDAGVCAVGGAAGFVGVAEMGGHIRTLTATISECGLDPIRVQPMHSQHTEQVTGLKFSRHFNMLVSCALDGSIIRHAIDNAETSIVTQHDHARSVLCMEWSEALQLLVTGGVDASVRIWSLVRREPQNSINVGAIPVSLAINERSNHLLVLTIDHKLKVFDLRTLRCLEAITKGGAGEPVFTDASARGATLARVASWSVPVLQGVVIHDAPHDQIITILKKPVRMRDASAAHRTMEEPQRESYSQQGCASSGKAHLSAIVSMQWSELNRTLYTCDRGGISAWHLATGEYHYRADVRRQPLWNGSSTPAHLVSLLVGEKQTSLVTLLASGDIVTWNALNGRAEHCYRSQTWAAPTSSQRLGGSYSALLILRHHAAVARGKAVYFLPWDHQHIVPDVAVPLKKTQKETCDVPGAVVALSATVTCLTELKDQSVAIGTLVGEVVLYSVSTGHRYSIRLASHELSSSVADSDIPGIELRAVESILFSNVNQRSIIVCLQTTGRVTVIHTPTRAVLGVFDPRCHQENVRSVSQRQYTVASLGTDEKENVLLIGDTDGGVTVIDISAAHIPVNDAAESPPPSAGRAAKRFSNTIASDSAKENDATSPKLKLGSGDLALDVSTRSRLSVTALSVGSSLEEHDKQHTRGVGYQRPLIRGGAIYRPHTVTRCHVAAAVSRRCHQVEFPLPRPCADSGNDDFGGLTPLIPIPPSTARRPTAAERETRAIRTTPQRSQTAISLDCYTSPSLLSTRRVAETERPANVRIVERFVASEAQITAILHVPPMNAVIVGDIDGAVRAWRLSTDGTTTSIALGEFVMHSGPWLSSTAAHSHPNVTALYHNAAPATTCLAAFLTETEPVKPAASLSDPAAYPSNAAVEPPATTTKERLEQFRGRHARKAKNLNASWATRASSMLKLAPVSDIALPKIALPLPTAPLNAEL